MRLLAAFAAMTFLFSADGMLPSEASQQTVRNAEGQVVVRGGVVSVDGKPQHNVQGRYASLYTYKTYYAGNGARFKSASEDPAYLAGNWYAEKDGKFQLTLSPGVYMLWAYGAKSRAVRLTVPVGTRSISVKITGNSHNGVGPFRLFSPEGKPLADANVFTNSGLGGITLDDDGIGYLHFPDSDPVVPMRFFLWKEGLGFAAVTIEREEDLIRKNPVSVGLQRGTLVSGCVISESTGTPLGGVVIFPVRVGKKGDKWDLWNGLLGDFKHSYTVNDPVAATSRDGDGAFTLGPLPPGDYNIGFAFSKAEAESFDFRREVPVHIAEGESVDRLVVKISVDEPAYEFKGRALMTGNNAPLGCAEITLKVRHFYPPRDKPRDWPEYWYVWEPVVRRVKTDRDGEFTLYPLAAGRYVFDVSWNGLSAEQEVIVPSDGAVVDLALQAPKIGSD